MAALPKPADHDSLDPHAGRRFLDPTSANREQTPTLVGHGSEFAGELQCPGDLTIAGHGHGTARIGVKWSRSHIKGEVHCEHAVLAGQFSGQLHARSKVEIHNSADVQGDLHATHIAIATGAIVAANLMMSDAEAPLRFDEKRQD